MNMPRYLHSRIARALKNDREEKERPYRRNASRLVGTKTSAA